MSLPDSGEINFQEYVPQIGKKSDLAYQALKRAIVLRHYPPGTQILEQTLAGKFHCSQSTIREVLLNLAKDGLVERRGYYGTFVTDTSLAEAAAMVKVRLTVERGVAATIATNGTRPDDENLNKVLEQMDSAHKGGDLYLGSELDRAFHSELANVANMNLLSPILQRCALHIHRYTLGSVEVPRDFFQESGIGDEHRVLLKKLCSGSTEQAEAAIVGHISHVLQRWSPSLYEEVGADAFAIANL